MKRKQYHTAELFYSLQGEGHRKGTANVFIRFAGCNLQCVVAKHGFDCDTDFTRTHTWTSAKELAAAAGELWPAKWWHDVERACILTGGEPLLQVDDELLIELHTLGFYVALETNGCYEIPDLVDYAAVSPKRGEPCVVSECDELRIVIDRDQHGPVDDRDILATNYFVSPSNFTTPHNEHADPMATARCVDICKTDPTWRLSVQDHKLWGVR